MFESVGPKVRRIVQDIEAGDHIILSLFYWVLPSGIRRHLKGNQVPLKSELAREPRQASGSKREIPPLRGNKKDADYE